MLQWLLALAAMLALLFGLTGILVALVYACALAVRVFPLVGRRKSVPGARTARERVVFRQR
jgi:hypothetical protein